MIANKENKFIIRLIKIEVIPIKIKLNIDKKVLLGKIYIINKYFYYLIFTFLILICFVFCLFILKEKW